jgi:hypothetical protein
MNQTVEAVAALLACDHWADMLSAMRDVCEGMLESALESDTNNEEEAARKTAFLVHLNEAVVELRACEHIMEATRV